VVTVIVAERSEEELEEHPAYRHEVGDVRKAQKPGERR
jgi:hypothetical protein